MARDWTDTQIVKEDILKRMASFGNNIAAIPYASALENRDGILTWVVDIHVKVHRVIEFDLSAEGATLGEALRCIYLGLNSEANLRRTNGEAGSF